jgi:hypothetical protein
MYPISSYMIGRAFVAGVYRVMALLVTGREQRSLISHGTARLITHSLALHFPL